jgi:type II secretory pathway component GspD/PulD (secretin)
MNRNFREAGAMTMRRKRIAAVILAGVFAAVLALAGVAAAAGKPAPAQKAPAGNEALRYKDLDRDRISMSFTSAPVGFILQSLGRLYGVNFSIAADPASKVVSVEMTDVLFSEALKMIQDAADVNIVKVKDGYYTVKSGSSEENLVTEEAKKIKDKERLLSQGIMDVVTVKYVDVKDVETTLRAALGEDNKELFKISKLNAEDNRNYNSLVIYAANQGVMDRIKDLVKRLDAPKPMIEIEATFVELGLSNNKDLGLNWDVMEDKLTFQENGDYSPTYYTNNAADNQPIKWDSPNMFIRTAPWKIATQLVAAAGSNRTRILANPRIRVMSGRSANFQSTQEFPILTRNNDGDVTTEWKNVGITLEVMPSILDDNTIQMHVVPTVETPVGEQVLGDVRAPIISRRKAESTVLLRPNETMIIGGLMQDTENKSVSSIPILSSLPLIGEMFKNRTTKSEKTTLVVLLRPVLVDYSNPKSSGTTADMKALWEKTNPVKPAPVIVKPAAQEKTEPTPSPLAVAPAPAVPEKPAVQAPEPSKQVKAVEEPSSVNLQAVYEAMVKEMEAKAKAASSQAPAAASQDVPGSAAMKAPAPKETKPLPPID